MGGAGINGHSLGHYLSAVSQLYAVTKNPVAKARVDYIVDELAECQRANKNGYVMTIPPGRVWDKVRDGTFSSGDFAVCGWWVPLYTLHKVFAGLRDAYRHAGNAKALDVERRLADWYLGVVGGLDDARLQSLLRSEWGGLNETFAQLYEDTGDSRYLDAAWRKFHQREALDPLMRGTDNLDGKHANVYIPKIVGLSLLYSITGRPEFRTAVDTFWESMTGKRAFVTGGHGEHEYLYDVSCTAQMLTDQNNEACGIYNLHRIAERTFTWNPTAATMDYVERSLINQLLAHVGRRPGEYCYFLSQRPADTKKFSKPYDSWWCCVGTGMENPQLYAALSYYHGADSLWVNLYHATTLRWPEKGLKARRGRTALPPPVVVRESGAHCRRQGRSGQDGHLRVLRRAPRLEGRRRLGAPPADAPALRAPPPFRRRLRGVHAGAAGDGGRGTLQGRGGEGAQPGDRGGRRARRIAAGRPEADAFLEGLPGALHDLLSRFEPGQVRRTGKGARRKGGAGGGRPCQNG